MIAETGCAPGARKAMQSDVAGALTWYEPAAIADALTVSVAQGDPGSVAVTLMYEG